MSYLEVKKKHEEKVAESQKFKRGWAVRVSSEMPKCMSHFESGFVGVVQYTHGQKYRSDDFNSYSLIVLDEDGEPINAISWYKENQLTLISDDAGEGKKVIEKWEFGE